MDELQFTWDPTKAAANLSKHRVSFEDASSVFRNPLASVSPDPTRTERERRLLMIGHSYLDGLEGQMCYRLATPGSLVCGLREGEGWRNT